MAKSEQYVVGIDIGSSKVAVLIGQRDARGGIEVAGRGVAPNRGTRRGNIVNVEAAVEALKAASEEAEVMAGVEISPRLRASRPSAKSLAAATAKIRLAASGAPSRTASAKGSASSRRSSVSRLAGVRQAAACSIGREGITAAGGGVARARRRTAGW